MDKAELNYVVGLRVKTVRGEKECHESKQQNNYKGKRTLGSLPLEKLYGLLPCEREVTCIGNVMKFFLRLDKLNVTSRKTYLRKNKF